MTWDGANIQPVVVSVTGNKETSCLVPVLDLSQEVEEWPEYLFAQYFILITFSQFQEASIYRVTGEYFDDVVRAVTVYLRRNSTDTCLECADNMPRTPRALCLLAKGDHDMLGGTLCSLWSLSCHQTITFIRFACICFLFLYILRFRHFQVTNETRLTAFRWGMCLWERRTLRKRNSRKIDENFGLVTK